MKNIAILASGTGSNALKIIEHFKGHQDIRVVLLVSNKAKAPVLEIAKQHEIPSHIVTKSDFRDVEATLDLLKSFNVVYIILAGFLWLIPKELIVHYPNRIINIHPSLLPKYGGKGMYGMHVHRAVKEHGERTSGMTIHYVNERFDEGKIIFQAECELSKNDSPKNIAEKVLALEHSHYPVVLENVIMNLN